MQESSNAIEALELISNGPRFDLVLTDIIMPHMSGKDLYDQIKRRVPPTKVDSMPHSGWL